MTGSQHAKSSIGEKNKKQTLRTENAYFVMRMSYVVGLFTDVVHVRDRFSGLIKGVRETYEKDLHAYNAERNRAGESLLFELRKCSSREAALAQFSDMVNGDARKTAIAMGLDTLLFVFSAISNAFDPAGDKYKESDMIRCASDGETDKFGVLSGRYVAQDRNARWFGPRDKRVADLGLLLSREIRKLSNFSVAAFFGNPVPEDKKTQAEVYKRSVSGICEQLKSEFGRGFHDAMKPGMHWLDPKTSVDAQVNDSEDDEDDVQSTGSRKRGKLDCANTSKMKEERGTGEPGKVNPLFIEDSSYSTDLNDAVW